MPRPEPITTTLSTKGQVVLPRPARAALGWRPGTRLLVETADDGLLLRPAPVFEVTRPEDVFGCLAADGPPLSIAEMDAGVLAEAKRRHEGD